MVTRPNMGKGLADDFNRQREHSLLAGLIQPGPPKVTDLAAALHDEELAQAHADLERLRADLGDAKITEEGASAMLAAAESAWTRAERHTPAEAQRLERLRAEAPAAAQAVADLEGQIAAMERRIATMKGAQEQERKRVLVAVAMTPVVARLIPAVRELLAALGEQWAVRDHLADAGAASVITLGELEMRDSRGADDLPRVLREWLSAAERSEYATGAQHAAGKKGTR